LVASALIVKLKQRFSRLKVSGFKPVVAGTYLNASGQRANEDLLSLITASGNEQSPHEICPYILDTPAAPHLVARDMALEMQISKIMTVLHELQEGCDLVVMEGAGGFLVPLNARESLSDLAVVLNWPVVLVVGLRLGCLNHALLSMEAIKSRGLQVAGWVANTIDPQMSHLRDNLTDLQKRIDAPLLGQIPFLPEPLHKSMNSPYSLEAIEWAATHLQLDALTRL
jgi:dethiobiotin synthetase